jgi:hypothetical protein
MAVDDLFEGELEHLEIDAEYQKSDATVRLNRPNVNNPRSGLKT